jgi:hypothetical protein
MSRTFTLALTTVGLLGLAVALPADHVVAQQKQQVSYKSLPENSKYTQQQVIDAEDAPGHQLRVYELFRSFPTNAPVINGVKLKETWSRGISDYTDSNGSNTNYTVYVLENGDKFFAKGLTIAQSPRSGKLSTTSVGQITGGTGKFAGMQGMIRASGTADPKAGFNEGQTEIEYWFAK